MAVMTTALTEFNDTLNSRTFTLSGHTAEKPRLVIQKRKVAANGASVASDDIQVVYATVDPDGNVLSSRVVFTVNVRRPINGASADVAGALAVFRDIVAGDEFGNTVTTQEYLS